MTRKSWREPSRRRVQAWAAASWLWALAIVAAGVAPTQSVVAAVAPQRQVGLTMSGHFAEYFVLAILLSGAFSDARHWLRRTLLPVALAVGLGAAVEATQSFLPYRDAQISDGLVNALGALAGAATYGFVRAARRR